jgi:hypothetical protein
VFVSAVPPATRASEETRNKIKYLTIIHNINLRRTNKTQRMDVLAGYYSFCISVIAQTDRRLLIAGACMTLFVLYTTWRIGVFCGGRGRTKTTTATNATQDLWLKLEEIQRLLTQLNARLCDNKPPDVAYLEDRKMACDAWTTGGDH